MEVPTSQKRVTVCCEFCTGGVIGSCPLKMTKTDANEIRYRGLITDFCGHINVISIPKAVTFKKITQHA